MHDVLKSLIKQFMPFAQKHIGFENPPKLFLKQDQENANNPLGKTAYYDPSNMSITLYTTDRHPKDILRSLGHELVHHKQNCEGKFDDVDEMEEGYAQSNPHLRQMEIEANRDGSMCLRDFEDTLKQNNTIYFEHLQKGDTKMSTKDWKNGEIKSLLSEAWGFKMDLSKLNEEKELKNPDKADLDDDGKLSGYEKKRAAAIEKSMAGEDDKDDEKSKNESAGVFAPNHYCIHHGGVHHEGQIKMAEAIQHVEPDENGHISHYDMRLEDGTILEDVAAESIKITKASLMNEHGDESPGMRDAHKPMKKRYKKPDDEEDLEEQSKSALPDRGLDRSEGGRRLDEEDEEVVEEDFPGKSDMETHKRDLAETSLAESRLKEIIAFALKTKV